MDGNMPGQTILKSGGVINVASHAWRKEAHRLLHLTAPLATSEVLAFGISIITTAFVGHLGTQQLSAWVLAHTFINLTGLSLVMGALSAMETFCGQAAGAQQHHTLGVSLQQGVVTSTVVALPCILVWTQCSRILQLLGQSEQISILAGHYVMWWAPTLLMYGSMEACQRFLVAQSVVAPSVIVMGTSIVLIGPLNWLFIIRLGWGLKGAAASYASVTATSVVLFVAIIVNLERKRSLAEKTWYGWSWVAFRGCPSYFRLAVPATCMMCLDWWSYEIVIILAGLLPNAEASVATMGIAFNTHALFYMLADGISAAVSTRVSNSLGANQPDTAKLSTTVATTLGAGVTTVAVALLIVFRRPWAILFTNDTAIIENLVVVIIPLGISLVGDSVSTVLGGVLRGAGRQTLGAIIAGLVAYCLGLPLQIALGFKLGLGVAGMWWGAAFSSTVQAVVEVICVWRFNWSREAQRAADLLRDTHGDLLLLADELESDSEEVAMAPLIPCV